MSSLRHQLEPCFILHQRAFKETSIILDIFSEKHGRLSLLAKGARQTRSSLKNILRPFSPLLLSWEGRGDLKILTDGQANGLPFWLEGLRLFTALYVNELLVRALHCQDAYQALYGHYEVVLKAIADMSQDSNQVQMSLRAFEFQLLSELGYGIDLSQSVNPKLALRAAIQQVLGDKILHSRRLVRQLLL